MDSKEGTDHCQIVAKISKPKAPVETKESVKEIEQHDGTYLITHL